jgi:hypothetical protein
MYEEKTHLHVVANPWSAKSVYFMLLGNPPQANSFYQLAGRITISLGGHLTCPVLEEDPMTDHTRSRNHIRRLFWVTYSVDKAAALRTGQFPFLDETNCNIQLPPGESLRCISYRSEILASAIPGGIYFLGDLRLSILSSKIYRELYSATAFLKNDLELAKAIRELDTQLEQWRLSIALPYRPRLLNSGQVFTQVRDADSESDRTQYSLVNWHYTVVHCEYYYLLTAIHRASGRCDISSASETLDTEALSSSIVIAIEASRSILQQLAVTVEFVIPQGFWYVSIMIYP